MLTSSDKKLKNNPCLYTIQERVTFHFLPFLFSLIIMAIESNQAIVEIDGTAEALAAWTTLANQAGEILGDKMFDLESFMGAMATVSLPYKEYIVRFFRETIDNLAGNIDPADAWAYVQITPLFKSLSDTVTEMNGKTTEEKAERIDETIFDWIDDQMEMVIEFDLVDASGRIAHVSVDTSNEEAEDPDLSLESPERPQDSVTVRNLKITLVFPCLKHSEDPAAAISLIPHPAHDPVSLHAATKTIGGREVPSHTFYFPIKISEEEKNVVLPKFVVHYT